MHCKSVIPSRALAQSQMSTTVSSRMVDMTPSPCRRSATTRSQYIYAANSSMTSKKWRGAPGLLDMINCCPALQAFRPSSRHGKSVPKIGCFPVAGQIQSRFIAGFRSPVTTNSPNFLQTSMSTPAPSDVLHPRWWIPKRLRK